MIWAEHDARSAVSVQGSEVVSWQRFAAKPPLLLHTLSRARVGDGHLAHDDPQLIDSIF